jgi:hypothetical protein
MVMTNVTTETNMSGEVSKPEALYTALVNVRNTELTVYWTRFNIQSAINLVLLAAALSSKSDSFVGKHMWFAAIAGIILAIIWLLFIVKGKQLLEDRWEPHIRKYEENTPQVQYKLFCEIQKEKERVRKCNKLRPRWDNLDYLSRSLPILCIAAWFIILVISLACKN